MINNTQPSTLTPVAEPEDELLKQFERVVNEVETRLRIERQRKIAWVSNSLFWLSFVLQMVFAIKISTNILWVGLVAPAWSLITSVYVIVRVKLWLDVKFIQQAARHMVFGKHHARSGLKED